MNYKKTELDTISKKQREISKRLSSAVRKGEIKLKGLVGNFGEIFEDADYSSRNDGFRFMFNRIDWSGSYFPNSIWKPTKERLNKELQRLQNESERQYLIVKDLL